MNLEGQQPVYEDLTREGCLRFVGVSKRFPGVLALSDVSLDARPWSVHGLVGENGAGKSTLLKILAGLYRPDAGQVLLGGRPASYRSPQEAIAAGIAVIHQELQLVPEMTVAENLMLGRMPHRWGWISQRRLMAAAQAQLARLEEGIDLSARVGRLPIAHRQMVEIAKALLANACVLAFDEPTSSLSQRETEKLFAIIRQLRADGCIILYVSHRMQEIFAICDAVTVLRDGRRVATYETMDDLTPDRLVGQMVGRQIEDIYGYRSREHTGAALQAEGLIGPGLTSPASFTLERGEVVGIFGLVGAGRTELLRLLAGARRARAGRVRLHGEPVVLRGPADAIRRGIVLCPEDRKKEGIFPGASVEENINLSARRPVRWGGFLHEAREAAIAREGVRRLSIRVASLAQQVHDLSGGNQQKCILARWLTGDVRVLLLDEPTRGIDVGAKSEIYAIIRGLAESGVAVLFASSELPEVLGIADRVLVMRQGALVGTLARGEATEEAVMRLALPVSALAASAG